MKYELIEEKYLEDIQAKGFLFKHKKSNANIVYIQNDDENRVFHISFKTPPKDNTGVFHILEHSVLCGSEKFDVKDPFNELAKGSLHTYLNAMTFKDKTMYPIASYNEKDFMNLIDVYMNAVLFPNIFKNREIFMQEGIRYELDGEQNELTYSGVVYNEMKGAFSAPERQLVHIMNEVLFDKTYSRFDSGGTPEGITGLTYEQFLDCYRQYYALSNSYIYLYGKINIDQYLAFLDENYLSQFSNTESAMLTEKQVPFDKIKFLEEKYPISAHTEEADKTIYSASFVISSCTDIEGMMGVEILKYMLLDTEASPLKRGLLDSQIGTAVEGSFNTSMYQPTFSVILKNAVEKKEEQFKNCIFDTLKNIAENGIDKDLMEAAFNKFEFALKEEDYGYRPKGLVYGINIMSNWLYGENPLDCFETKKIFEIIKNKSKDRYFENLIEIFLLKNNHGVFVTLVPEKGLEIKNENKIRESLQEHMKSLSKEAVEKIKADQEILKIYQDKKETKEQLEKIPTLHLSDIKKDMESIEKIVDGNIYYTPQKANGIFHTVFSFDTTKVPQAYLGYLGLLGSLLGKVETENYSFQDLTNKINTYLGRFGVSQELYLTNENQEYSPSLCFKIKTTSQNMKYIFEILNEIIFHTKVDNHLRIKEIVKELKSKMERNFQENGHLAAIVRGASYFSDAYYYMDCIRNISFYDFLTNLDFETVSDKLRDVCKYIFAKQNCSAFVAGEKEDYQYFSKVFLDFYNKLDDCNVEKQMYPFENKRNEGFMTSSKILYNVKLANIDNFHYHGSMLVLKNIIRLEYLWNEIRVKGGAYGASISLTKNGLLYEYSYRDPNLEKTYASYNNTLNFVKGFNASAQEMRKFIIGTINSLDKPLSVNDKLETMISRHFGKTTNEDLQKERDEVLSTTVGNIRDLSYLMEAFENQHYICTIGNEEIIKNNESLFREIRKI